jgi:hypothetical protein
MVLAAGFTSRREPASFSRRLVELAFEGDFELVVTEILLDEVYAVLVDPKFIGQVSGPEAALFVESTRRDRGDTDPGRAGRARGAHG